MNLEDLHEASWNGAVFLLDVADRSGGFKVAEQVFLDSDLQIIDDTGLMPDAFVLTGTIAQQTDNEGNILRTYRNVRDSLLRALKKTGTGILIHPFYGRIEGYRATTFNLSERLTALGNADIVINFKRSDVDGLPVASVNVLSNISTQSQNVQAAGNVTIANKYSVISTAVGNFADAVDKLEDVFVSIKKATSPITALASEIDTFNQRLSTFQSNIVSLVSAPTKLADSITGIMSGIGALYSTGEGTVKAFSNLFNFGDDDEVLVERTQTIAARQVNREVINDTIQASALSESYLAAAGIDFKTVDEIEEQANTLEVQFQKLIVKKNLEVDLLQTLTDIRIVAQGFFEEQKLTARRVIEVQTTPISTRALAYRLYGSSELGESIAELNGFSNSVHRQGTVKVFEI